MSEAPWYHSVTWAARKNPYVDYEQWFVQEDEPFTGHDVCQILNCGGQSKAEFIAAAPSTAKERDELKAETERLRKEGDELFEIGKRDGHDDAVQEIDCLTGGDGEYRGSSDPARCSDAVTMKAGIVDRFDTLRAEVERLREALTDIDEMTDPDGEDNYRADDREGCLDMVHATARAALSTDKVQS